MPDPIFAERRLAAVYDAFDPDRSDLDVYAALIGELGARRVLDVGCGTGILACLLAERGVDVVGLDPAGASLDVARSRPGAERVRWIEGVATALAADPPLPRVDLAVMTANVAQVFVDDGDWTATLAALADVVAPGGHLVLETRVPERRIWEEWVPERTRQRLDLPDVGAVERWCELVDVDLPLVTFRWTHVFESDGATLASDSTLVFRSREQVAADLVVAGFVLEEVRDAPDRPGREHVFVARRRAPVVAAAILREGRVLAARRTSPPEVAGRWELPGGKVEPGEDAEAALLREIAEELGLRIAVTGWLDGESPIGESLVLRAALAEVLDGEPEPTEHDAVRWLGADDLDDVDWLEPDRPFLPAVRAMLER